MNPLHSLSPEQTRLLDRLERCQASTCREAQAALADEACRLATRISRVREEIVHPACVPFVPWSLLSRAVIDWDLVRVLVAETLDASPGDLLFAALLDAAHRILSALFEDEDAHNGLWATVLAAGLDVRDLDDRVGDRLRELASAADEGWLPAMPLALETVRSSVSPPAP